MATQTKSRRTKKTTLTRRGKPAAKSSATPTVVVGDRQAAFQTVMELMAIRGTSGHEGAVADYITRKLRAAGAPAASIRSDNANKKTPLAGEVGNLIFQMPG